MPYTLITVTRGGEVHHARGFETLRMCQEARSIALYGCTIAERQEREREAVKAAAESLKRRDERFMVAWRERHPPREATMEEKARLRSLILSWPMFEADHPYLGSPFWLDNDYIHARVTRASLGADGMVYEWPQIYAYGSSATGWTAKREPDPGEILHAHCVIEVPDYPSTGVAA